MGGCSSSASSTPSRSASQRSLCEERDHAAFETKLVAALRRRKERLDKDATGVPFSFTKIILKFGTIHKVLRRIRAIFSSFDHDHDGTITKRGFVLAMDHLHVTMPPEEILHLFEVCDMTNSDTLGLREFYVMLAVARVLDVIPEIATPRASVVSGTKSASSASLPSQNNANLSTFATLEAASAALQQQSQQQQAGAAAATSTQNSSEQNVSGAVRMIPQPPGPPATVRAASGSGAALPFLVSMPSIAENELRNSSFAAGTDSSMRAVTESSYNDSSSTSLAGVRFANSEAATSSAASSSIPAAAELLTRGGGSVQQSSEETAAAAAAAESELSSEKNRIVSADENASSASSIIVPQPPMTAEPALASAGEYLQPLGSQEGFQKVKWTRIPSLQRIVTAETQDLSVRHPEWSEEEKRMRQYGREVLYAMDLIIAAYFQFDVSARGYIDRRDLIARLSGSEGEGRLPTGSGGSTFSDMAKWGQLAWDSQGRLSFEEFVYTFSHWLDIEEDEEDELDLSRTNVPLGTYAVGPPPVHGGAAYAPPAALNT